MSFEYGLKLGGVKSDSYLKLMNWQAEKAALLQEKEGIITVIVQDNHPIHMSKEVRPYWPQWEEKGLYLFQLLKYSSEMNKIEGEWHQLKTHELSASMFEVGNPPPHATWN